MLPIVELETVMNDEQECDLPKISRYERLMRAIAVGILGFGLSISVIVYVMAPPDDNEEDGGMYVASIDNSKKYQLELERIGGKAALVAVEFNNWFAGLWHGKRLAGSLAVLSIGGSLLCFLASKVPPLDD